MLRDAPLETARLLVRRLRPDDIDWMVALFADPEVARFVDDGAAMSRANAGLWVTRSNENIDLYGYGTGAVIAKAGGAAIGWAGVARPGDGSEEIIYGLARSHWGRGLAGEIVDALVDIVSARGVRAIRATVARDNRASVALLVRRGFRVAERDHGDDAGVDLYVRSGA